MRFRLVTRASLLLALLLTLACVVVAWSAGLGRGAAATATPLTPEAGAQAFGTLCARCHAADDAAEFLATRPAGARAVFELEAFLAEHAPAEPTTLRAVVLWLDERRAAR